MVLKKRREDEENELEQEEQEPVTRARVVLLTKRLQLTHWEALMQLRREGLFILPFSLSVWFLDLSVYRIVEPSVYLSIHLTIFSHLITFS